MTNPVDNMLTSRIKQVFDEFEDPAADAGWEQLRKKYPERNRRPLVLWLSSAAAILMLVTGLWFVNSPKTPVVMKPVKEEKSLARADKTMPLAADSVNSARTAGKRESEQGTTTRLSKSTPDITDRETEKTLLTALPAEEEVMKVSELESLPEHFPDKVTATALKDEIPLARVASLAIKIRQDFEKVLIDQVKKPTYIKDEKVSAIALADEIPLARTLVIKTRQDFDKIQIEQAKKPTHIENEKITAIALSDEIPLARAATLVIKPRQDFDKIWIEQAKKPTYLNEFNPDPVENEKKDENMDAKRKKLVLGVFAGSYFNYAEGSENQLNFGAGFTSDIRLGKNLKLSTGLSIASNSLNYDKGQDVPESAASSFYSTTSSPIKSPGSSDLTTITSYSASLLTLDIPINIKYQFVPESDKIYVLAGLSSGTYLNETYGYHFRSYNIASGSYSSQAQDQKSKKQLDDFDLARTLNLSFGISTVFGKSQTMSIEPFIKYPLGGLGTEDLKFGSTGINLKIRFNPSKK